MLSREKREITPDYMTTIHELHAYLGNRSDGNAVRVTVVTMTEDPDTNVKSMELVWSKSVGGLEDHTDINAISSRIPDMAVGDQMILVEGVQAWTPAFNIGLPAYNFRQTAVLRPRPPQLKWSDA